MNTLEREMILLLKELKEKTGTAEDYSTEMRDQMIGITSGKKRSFRKM